MEVHVGKILERAIRRQEMSISELCRRLNISRGTLYNWFEREAVDISIVSAVGKIIGRDFADELGDTFTSVNNQSFNGDRKCSPLPETNASIQGEEYYWMQKYIQLLENYNQLLQKVAV